jgi:hypothetical protein
MEQNKELMVYKFEATRLKKNEDGTVSDEIETIACGYAFEGDPSPRIEYNRYWEFGDGCLSLISKDGRAVDSCVDSMLEWMYDQGFRGVDINKMIDRLDAPGKWAEVCLGDAVKTMLRVTRLKGLPEIDREATIRDSDLSPAQQHCVKIDGVPLFPEGGTVNASNPKAPTLVLRPDLVRELGKVWEEVIYSRGGVKVHVEADAAYRHSESAGGATARLTIKAPTRKELDSALCAVGVLRPQDVEPDVVEGQDGETTRFTATVILTTDV